MIKSGLEKRIDEKILIRCTTILLAFLAGAGFMSYMTYVGNRDMTAAMADATLPVAYAQWEGKLCNEMHGYVEPMDGSYMKESLLGAVGGSQACDCS